MKKIAGIVALLAGFALITYFTLSNPLGRLVKLGMESFGPDMLQAEVRVSSVQISTGDGEGKLNGLKIGNPKGFKADHALKADAIGIVVEPASITQDVVVLHKVVIDAPYIIYEKGDRGTNFEAIQHNVESYLGASKSRKVEEGKSKKFIIESFVIRNAKVNYNETIDLSLPDIELHNIGKKGGGATSAQVTRAVIAELNAKLALALAKAAVVTSVGGVAVGASLAVKSLLGR